MRKKLFAIRSVLVVSIVLIAVLVPSCAPAEPTTIDVEATLDDAPWSGAVQYTLTTTEETIDGTSVPTTHDVTPDTWTCTYVSGGPSDAYFVDITPPSTQSVSRGDTITFDLNFAAYQPLTLTPEEEALHASSKTDYSPLEMWEGAITGFETEDSINPPPEDAILFVGSSSIVFWDTEKWFPDLTTINRGFGGSVIMDCVYYVDRVIIPYEPATIVFYSGDNDFAWGKPPEMILADLKVLLIEIRQALPQTRIIVLSIKPSFSRWDMWPSMQEANDRISNLCKIQQNIYYADVAEVMFDETGELRDDIFLEDGLHMNETGYELWTPVVRAFIDL